MWTRMLYSHMFWSWQFCTIVQKPDSGHQKRRRTYRFLIPQAILVAVPTVVFWTEVRQPCLARLLIKWKTRKVSCQKTLSAWSPLAWNYRLQGQIQSTVQMIFQKEFLVGFIHLFAVKLQKQLACLEVRLNCLCFFWKRPTKSFRSTTPQPTRRIPTILVFTQLDSTSS